MNELVKEIEQWFKSVRRMLPWRMDTDPYHVWISEIMLQQTRIEAVITYYERFMTELPTVHDLANVEEDKLLKLWEGLGYYNRARNLKKAALIIEKEYQGKFPHTYQELIQLPGIGDYTASAISSICYQEKQATIDGNVLRVYTRFNNDFSNIDLATTRKRIQQEIIQILPKESGLFNEALMEIGETICLPNGTPLCTNCPLKKKCLATKERTYLELPVKNPKLIKKEIKYTILLFKNKDSFVIEKREDPGILTKMWQFPNLEGHLSQKKLKQYLKENLLIEEPIKFKKSISTTHIFTHQKWNMISYIIEVEKKNNQVWKTPKEIIENYAIPSAFQPFLKEIEENK